MNLLKADIEAFENRQTDRLAQARDEVGDGVKCLGFRIQGLEFSV